MPLLLLPDYDGNMVLINSDQIVRVTDMNRCGVWIDTSDGKTFMCSYTMAEFMDVVHPDPTKIDPVKP